MVFYNSMQVHKKKKSFASIQRCVLKCTLLNVRIDRNWFKRNSRLVHKNGQENISLIIIFYCIKRTTILCINIKIKNRKIALRYSSQVLSDEVPSLRTGLLYELYYNYNVNRTI